MAFRIERVKPEVTRPSRAPIVLLIILIESRHNKCGKD